jgi:hypothetical protein
MALTFSRWTVIVGLGCAGVALALLPVPPRTVTRSFMAAQSTRLQRVTGQLERARDTLELVALGDSVLDIVRKSPPAAGGKPTILDLGAATVDERRAFALNVDAWWPDTGLDSSVSVALVLAGDSRHNGWQPRHMLPASGDGRTCVTLIPTNTWKLASRMPGPRALELRFSSELGPCLFMAVYGRPGPHIEQWLGGRGLDFIGYLDPSGRTIVESIDLPDDELMKASLMEIEWAVYGTTMPLGIPCLYGDVEQCAKGVEPFDNALRPVRPGFRAPSLPWRVPFGRLTSSFLADLHREIGPEQFRAFWHSPGTVDEAFRQATGQSLGEWTHHWAVGHRGMFRSGPLPEHRSVLRVAGLSLLLLGISLVYSVRRTVA